MFQCLLPHLWRCCYVFIKRLFIILPESILKTVNIWLGFLYSRKYLKKYSILIPYMRHLKLPPHIILSRIFDSHGSWLIRVCLNSGLCWISLRISQRWGITLWDYQGCPALGQWPEPVSQFYADGNITDHFSSPARAPEGSECEGGYKFRPIG